MTIRRLCLECRQRWADPRSQHGARCTTCEHERNAARNRHPTRRAYTRSTYRTLRRQVTAGQHGPCVDCATWNDLTCDHLTPLAAGGEHGPIVVRCRPCNSRKGATQYPGLEKR